jgi:hypothetical protein
MNINTYRELTSKEFDRAMKEYGATPKDTWAILFDTGEFAFEEGSWGLATRVDNYHIIAISYLGNGEHV